MAKKKGRRQFGNVTQLPSGRWRARYNHMGEWHNAPQTFRAELDADGWLASERKLIDLNVWEPPAIREWRAQQQKRDNELTTGIWITQWLENRQGELRESTWQQYERVIRNRITNVQDAPEVAKLSQIPINELDKRAVHDWWDAMAKTFHTPQTNRKAYVYLKAAFNEAVDREMLKANPVQVKAAKHKPAPKDKELPTTADLTAILNATPDCYKLPAMLFLFMGMRIGEALALKRGELVNVGTKQQPQWVAKVRSNVQRVKDKDTGKVKMVEQLPKTKAGRRDVPIFTHFNDIVRSHLDSLKPGAPGDYLTTTREGKVVMDTSMRSVIGRAAERAKVTAKITPHYGRNWLITHMAEQGATPVEIGQILGQSDLKTITEIYMKARPENIATVMGRIELGLLGGGDVVPINKKRA